MTVWSLIMSRCEKLALERRFHLLIPHSDQCKLTYYKQNHNLIKGYEKEANEQ